MFTLALTFSAALAGGELPIVVEGELCHPNRLLVKAPVSRVASVAPAAGLKVLKGLPEIGWSVVQVPDGRLRQAKAWLAAQAGVQEVEFDRAAKLAYEPNDPLWPDQWHMRSIRADKAWDIDKGNSSVVVAVIDTGVLRTHEDLASNMWENTAEIAGNGLDDDGNGYIDDRYGWDFAYNDNDPEDVWGHGTPCAGLVAAVQDNSKGGSGVAPRARIMAIKACNHDGYLFDSYLVPGYVYAANMGAKVFSMSFFSDRVSQAEKAAMDYAVSLGVLPVAAAGNASSVVPFYPGAYENVLSVAAVNGSNQRSWFSDYGSWVDVAAPGEGLTTTGSGGGYGGFGGTSGACPHVAGAAALLFAAGGSPTAEQVRTALEDTATTLDQPPYGEFANYGLINVQSALQALLAGSTTPKPAVVRYVSTMGRGPAVTGIGTAGSQRARIYGRGFQALTNLIVKRGGKSVPVVGRSRDWVDFTISPKQTGDLTVWNGPVLVATVPNPPSLRTCHPLVEASEPSAWVDGGFFQTVVDDGQEMVGHPDGNNEIVLQGTFRNLTTVQTNTLRINRRYSAAGGTEYLQLYDWTSNSYPYGNWVTVWSGAPGTSPSTTAIGVAQFWKYVDFEKTTYFRLYATGIPAGTTVSIDSLRIEDGL
ncbi:MAG: S8 family serine peptidase [Armatimonadetes bacterium]|nr:S8 family serine peptidase [Armatimonadota bacterium]